MKKWLLSLCMVLALVACKEDKKDADAKPVIKIGVTLPLTGHLAHIGKAAQNAMQMVLEKWQKEGSKYQYEIVYEDDMVKPQQAALNTNKFISLNDAKVVVSVFGVVDRAVDDIANRHKVISLSCSYGKGDLPEYGLNIGTQNEEIYATTLHQLRKRNAKKVALAGSNAGMSNAILDYVAEHLPQDNIEVIANEKHAIGETDYRISIQKLEQSKPDYYLIYGVEPMNSLFVKQYKELTGKDNIASLGAFPNIDLKYFQGIMVDWSIYLVGGTESFEKAYKNKFNSKVEGCTANLYDGLDILIKAFENTKPREGETIPNNADVLKTVKDFKTWNGAFGEMKIEENGVIRSQAEARVYKDGQWVKIEE